MLAHGLVLDHIYFGSSSEEGKRVQHVRESTIYARSSLVYPSHPILTLYVNEWSDDYIVVQFGSKLSPLALPLVSCIPYVTLIPLQLAGKGLAMKRLSCVFLRNYYPLGVVRHRICFIVIT